MSSNAIFTGLTDLPQDGCVVIKGSRIVDAGDKRLAGKWQGPQTKYLKFEDQLIMPGFCESHAHIFFGALEFCSANVSEARSEEEAVQMLAGFDHSAAGMWVIGFGWNRYAWEKDALPTKKTLDASFPDRPALVFDAELHSLWVNSKTLEICGINRNTPDPAGGKITRDADNEPTGHLLEPAAMALVLDEALQKGLEDERKLFQKYFKKTAALGITSISAVPDFGLKKHGIYEELDRQGELNLRIHLVESANEKIEDLIRLRSRLTSGRLNFSGVKEFIDGTAMAHTGLLLEPYCDMPSYRGRPLVDIKSFTEKVVELDRHGFRIRLHACGDGAVRLALDIYEETRRINGPRDSRHTVEHIENINPADLPRFRANGVIASVQPEHLSHDNYAGHPFHKILGKKRVEYAWPFKSLLTSGATVAFGSDHPVVDLNPLQGIYRAVTRLMDDGKPEGGWMPQEKLSLAEALKGYTVFSAFQMFREKDLGTLEAGKLADIIVLDRNIFGAAYEEIKEAKPLLTMLNGNVIHG